MREAKQLLIQQKLEAQGQLDSAQASLQQEHRDHQATRDSIAQREEQILSQAKELQAQLVRTMYSMHRKLNVIIIIILFSK